MADRKFGRGLHLVLGACSDPMPTKPRPEDRLIDLFLSGYDNGTWNSCEVERLDQKQDGAVEVLATRTSDKLTLAIEHTLIQPYGECARDFAWHKVFSPIEKDPTLVLRNRWTTAFVSAGTLRPGEDWKLIASTVHAWLRLHVPYLAIGDSSHVVSINGSADCRLLTRVQEVPDFDGLFQVGIDGAQLPVDSLEMVVEKALASKTPKLAKTSANRRILMLERTEFTLSEEEIAREIERTRSSYPALEEIQEIWFAETVAFRTSQYVRFSVRRDGRPLKILAFHQGRVHERYEG